MAQSKEFPQYKWSNPKSYTKGRKSGQPRVVFIHTTEGSEGRSSAEDGAAYDARRTDGTSTHFFVDQDSTIQEVLTTDESHAARTHGNDVGIQIEVCGKAGQSVTQWADAASAGAIEQCAKLAVALRKKYPGRFPLINLTPAELRANGTGFAEHKDATLAWPADKGTHEDPGPNFPWSKLFARIKQLETPVATKPPVKEDDMDLTAANLTAIAKAVWDAKGDVDTTTKGVNLQPRGSIVDYGSSEHHQAIDAAREAVKKVDALTVKVDAILAVLAPKTGTAPVPTAPPKA
jgi:N-acetyl-anhydromuramyl-L-alanine amidase AmpD